MQRAKCARSSLGEHTLFQDLKTSLTIGDIRAEVLSARYKSSIKMGVEAKSKELATCNYYKPSK